jgi:hypothetical protein
MRKITMKKALKATDDCLAAKGFAPQVLKLEFRNVINIEQQGVIEVHSYRREAGTSPSGHSVAALVYYFEAVVRVYLQDEFTKEERMLEVAEGRQDMHPLDGEGELAELLTEIDRAVYQRRWAEIDWKVPEGYAIVGYDVEETEWNGDKEYRDWDTVKSVRVVDRVLTQELGDDWFRKHSREDCSYFIRPLMVKTKL